MGKKVSSKKLAVEAQPPPQHAVIPTDLIPVVSNTVQTPVQTQGNEEETNDNDRAGWEDASTGLLIECVKDVLNECAPGQNLHGATLKQPQWKKIYTTL